MFKLVRELHECLLEIYNRMLLEESLEPSWQHTFFKMLPKPGSTQASNWRPIAVLKIKPIKFRQNYSRATILSVDAVGAFDHVSRGAMLGARHARRELHPLLPFARQFYSSPSVYTWWDNDGCAHDGSQGAGGEQGDPLKCPHSTS